MNTSEVRRGPALLVTDGINPVLWFSIKKLSSQINIFLPSLWDAVKFPETDIFGLVFMIFEVGPEPCLV